MPRNIFPAICATVFLLAGCNAAKTFSPIIPDAVKSLADLVLVDGKGDQDTYAKLLAGLDEDPTSVRLQEALALCAWRMGDDVKAIRHADQALDYDSESRMATETLLLAASRQGLDKKVVSAIKNAPERFFDDKDFLLNGGYALLDVGMAQDAARLFRKAMDIKPDERACAAFALACVTIGRDDVAEKELAGLLPPHRVQAVIGAANLRMSKTSRPAAKAAATRFKRAMTLAPAPMPAAEIGYEQAVAVVQSDEVLTMLLVGLVQDEEQAILIAQKIVSDSGRGAGFVQSPSGYGVMMGPFASTDEAFGIASSLPDGQARPVTIKAGLVNWVR